MDDADLVAWQVVEEVRGDVIVDERGEQCALLRTLGEGGIGKEADSGAGLLGQLDDALVGLGAGLGPQQLGSGSIVSRHIDSRRLKQFRKLSLSARARRSRGFAWNPRYTTRYRRRSAGTTATSSP